MTGVCRQRTEHGDGAITLRPFADGMLIRLDGSDRKVGSPFTTTILWNRSKWEIEKKETAKTRYALVSLNGEYYVELRTFVLKNGPESMVKWETQWEKQGRR